MLMDALPTTATDTDVENWLNLYHDYLEHYGAFIRTWDEALANDPKLQLQSHSNAQRSSSRRRGLALAGHAIVPTVTQHS